MTHSNAKRTHKLSTLIGGAILLSLLALLLPGIMLFKSLVESRLVEERLAVVQNIKLNSARELNNRLVSAEESVQRFARLISSIPVSSSQDRVAEFHQLVVKQSDGAWRSDPDSFSATDHAGIWLPESTDITDTFADFLVTAKQLTETFGKGALAKFVDGWILPKEGGIVIYWPTQPDWIYGAEASLDYSDTEWVLLTHPEINPEGRPDWTSTSFDPAPKVWMISVVAPFFRDGEWAGAVGHDLPINLLAQQFANTVLYPNSEYHLVRGDGALILSNRYQQQILDSSGRFSLADTDARDLMSLLNTSDNFDQANSRIVVPNDDSGEFATTIYRIDRANWYFISRTQRADMLSVVRSTYDVVWLFITTILIACSLFISLLLSRLIVPPVNRLVSASRAIAGGELDYQFAHEGISEFGVISRSFSTMVQTLKKTLDDAEASRNRYESLVSRIPGAVYRCKWKRDWEFIFVSERIEDITGYPATDFINNYKRSFASVVHPDDRDMVDSRVRESVRLRQPFSMEYRVIHRGGDVRWVLEKGQAAFNAAGEPLWLDGTIFDESENKKLEFQRDAAEEEKRNLERKLQHSQKMEAIGTLAGGVAHDFNNVLSSIIGYTEIAKAEAPPESSIGTALEQVLASAYRASDLVKQILAFSRKVEQKSEILNPAGVIRQAIKMLRPTIPATIEIEQRIDSDCGLISADSTHIQQIFVNLCTNAFHAMEATGGKLTIRMRKTDIGPVDQVSGPAPVSSGWLELQVIDTGPGIDTSIIDNIFEPYFTTKEFGKGTGMGLSIVHGLVKSHKGHISVKSTPGHGTVFTIHFPLQEELVVAPEHGQSQQEPKSGSERILFVDDEIELGKIAKFMLTSIGYEVTNVYSAPDALALFTQDPQAFDLVITDQTMPELTGVDLAREILKIRPDMPVILCTGYSSITTEEQAREIGIRDFLLKPLSMKVLAQRIATIMNKD